MGALATLTSIKWHDRRAWIIKATGWSGLTAVLAAAWWFRPEMHFPGSAALLPAAGTAGVLIAGGANTEWGLARLLSFTPLQLLGKLSYSWYLWHWPILAIALAAWPHLSLAGRCVAAVGALALATVSYHIVEQPLRFHPRLLVSTSASLRLALLLAVCGVGLAAAGRVLAGKMARSSDYAGISAAESDFIRPEACLEWSGSVQLESCTDNPNIPTIAVFGDSHATQWIPSLTGSARPDNWRLVAFTKNACPGADVRVDNPEEGDRFDAACAQWRKESLATIADLNPTVVVMASSQEHVQGMRRKDHRRRATVEEWRAGTRSTLQLLNSVGIPVVLIRDTPRLGIDVPVCLGRAQVQVDWNDLDCESSRKQAVDDDVFAAELAAATGLHSITLADFTNLFCGSSHCPPVRNGIVLYKDEDHVTRAYAQLLSRVVWERVAAAMEF